MRIKEPKKEGGMIREGEEEETTMEEEDKEVVEKEDEVDFKNYSVLSISKGITLVPIIP
jgi:hypothetical protein